MIKVIINADDLGKDPAVNAEINSALQKHLITSSTILANSDYWDDIHRVVTNNPEASFGVHLNLTEGKALTESPIFHKLNIVDEHNCFTKKIQTISECGDELLESVFLEWDAQVNKIVNEENIVISHFDGHHHIHTKWEFRYVLSKLLKQYSVSRIRNQYIVPYSGLKKTVISFINCAAKLKPLSALARKHKNSLSLLQTCYPYMEAYQWRLLFQKNGISMSDYFCAYETWIKMVELGLKFPDNTILELMCHPGSSKYESEFNKIKEGKLSIIQPEAKLINYYEF